MPEEISVQLPKKILDFIDKLIEQGYFNSRTDFARSSIEIITQLYGLSETSKGGKALLDFIADKGKSISVPIKNPTTTTVQTKTEPIKAVKDEESLSSMEFDIIDLFVESSFEYEDALHAKYTMELMKIAKPPVPKETFLKILENLAAKKKLEKNEHNGKTIWKIISRY